MTAHAAQPHDPRIGMVLQDRYRILRKIGDGGMGSVYEGEHLLIKRRVAIKVLHAHFANNADIVARFRREAEAATAIGHPNIIEVTDMGSFPDGSGYMVLEFLEGRDWSRDISTEGPQPLGKVVHIIGQVCDALTAAHAKGIVHRDLKPDNVFLVERGGDRNFAKVLDFGISKFADPSAENHSLTQTGTAIGTPYYMAPEQCQGKKDIDHRADIYSLGVILFQALTRQYPFDDESYPMLVLKICTEPPPPLAHYRPDLPPELIAIVGRMLAKDRNHRFASCAEVKAALEPFRHVNAPPVIAANAPSTAHRGPAVLERAVSPVSTPSAMYSSPGMSSPEIAPPRSSRGLLWAVIAALFVFVLAGGTLGAMLAFGVFSPDPVVARTEQAPDDVEAAQDPEPAARPPEVAETPPPEVPAVPTTPAAPATVRVEVGVEGPDSAQIFIDGVLWGSAPNAFDVRRDPPPEAGAPPALHTIEVRADGWESARAEVPFTGPQERTFVMERVSRAPRHQRPRPDLQPQVRRFGGPAPAGGGFGQPRPRPASGGGLVGVGNIIP